MEFKELVELAEENQKAVEARFTTLETQIDELTASRKAVDITAETNEASEVFTKFLRTGEVTDTKYLVEGTNNVGGFLVPTDTYFDIHNKIVKFSPIRQYATVVQTGSNRVELPVEASQFAAAWTTETGQRTDSAGQTFGQVVVDAHEMYVRIPVSNALLEDSAVDLEAWLIDRAAAQFAALEGKAFVQGTGSGQPLGFTDGSDGFGKWNGATKTSFNAADLINAFYALDEVYAANSVWVMNAATVATIRNMKDGNQYVWQPALADGTPSTLLGRPVVISNDMPAPASATESPVAVLADLRAGYAIADRIGMEIQRDPYSRADYGQTVFRIRRRVGGSPLLTEAGLYIHQAGS